MLLVYRCPDVQDYNLNQRFLDLDCLCKLMLGRKSLLRWVQIVVICDKDPGPVSKVSSSKVYLITLAFHTPGVSLLNYVTPR